MIDGRVVIAKVPPAEQFKWENRETIFLLYFFNVMGFSWTLLDSLNEEIPAQGLEGITDPRSLYTKTYLLAPYDGYLDMQKERKKPSRKRLETNPKSDQFRHHHIEFPFFT